MAGYYPGNKSIWIKMIADRPLPIEHSLAIQMDIHSTCIYHWLPLQV